MKTLQRLCAALVLTLTLGVSALAGEMQTTVVSQPPPPDQAAQATTMGEMQTTVTGDMTTGVTPTTTEIALNLIVSVLSIF